MPSLGIASLSLGSFEFHTLESKLSAAAKCGFEEIELFDLDWQSWRDSYAAEHSLETSTHEGDATSLLAAVALGNLVKSLGLKFSCWQPLRDFEGHLDPIAREKARAYAKGILAICPALGTTLVLCCSSTTPAPQTTGDLARCTEDLAWLADEAAKFSPPIRIMYEGLSFGAHRRSWQDAWEVVAGANRINFGICLDSFNTLALEWADPYEVSGIASNNVDLLLEANMEELVKTVSGDKIFFYQIADGKKMSPPLPPQTDFTIPRIRPWSRTSRLFPGEQELGAYLPIDKFSDAVLRCGYSGPWSLEVFNSSLSEKDSTVPIEHGIRGIKGLRKCIEECYERVNGSSAEVSLESMSKL